MDKMKIALVVGIICLGLIGLFFASRSIETSRQKNNATLDEVQTDQSNTGQYIYPELSPVIQESTVQSTPKVYASATAPTKNEIFSISIPSINISAPIKTNVDGKAKEEYMKALEMGVAHLKGTALPGALGNTVIFGHSSYFKNLPGNFKEIFSKNNDIEIGDTITIKSNLGRTLNYRVVSKEIVLPEDVEVVRQRFDESKLTLITCWPVYSTAKRLVVVADKI
jgi:sortase A